MKKIILCLLLASQLLHAATIKQNCLVGSLTVTVDDNTIKLGENISPHYKVDAEIGYDPFRHANRVLIERLFNNSDIISYYEKDDRFIVDPNHHFIFEGKMHSFMPTTPGVYSTILHAKIAQRDCDVIVKSSTTVLIK